jgi:phage terminase large subunit GpA-like protein
MPLDEGALAYQDLAIAWGGALKPEPAMTVSEWADRHRVLGNRQAAEPGPWRTSRTPYLRAIMDALSPSHPARRVVFMKGAQIGGTECGVNWLGFIIHHAPGAILAVQPHLDLAKRFSRQRIDALIQETPAVRDLVAPAKARDRANSTLMKEFPLGVLVMTGANAPAGLRQMPVRYLFLDEVDAYPVSAGKEGDPIALAEARTQNSSWRAKIFLVSTPTLEGASRIADEYARSNRQRYFVPCPHCGHRQWLRWERLSWREGEPESVVYLCEACGVGIEERYKTEMLTAGSWEATATSEDPHTVGFHLSSLYSPLGWLSWASIVRQRERIVTDEQHQAFKNSVLGETWRPRGEAPPWEALLERREEWSPRALPAGVLLLTAGVDVQGDRLEARVWGWGRGGQRWLVAVAVMPGDPARAETWRGVDQMLSSAWPSELGGQLQISRIAVDTGYATEDVYTWARRYAASLVMLVKGDSRRLGAIGARRAAEVTSQGKSRRYGVHVWPVNPGPLKSRLYGALRQPAPGAGEPWPPGWVHLPSWCSEDEIRQLTAEQLVRIITRSGVPKFEWQLPSGRRNEALDCAIYAHAAAISLGIDRWAEQRWAQLERQLTVAQRSLYELLDRPDAPAAPAEPAAPEAPEAPDGPPGPVPVPPIVTGRLPAPGRPGAVGPPASRRRVVTSSYVL